MNEDQQHKEENDRYFEFVGVVHRSLLANLNQRQNHLSKGNEKSHQNQCSESDASCQNFIQFFVQKSGFRSHIP